MKDNEIKFPMDRIKKEIDKDENTETKIYNFPIREERYAEDAIPEVQFILLRKFADFYSKIANYLYNGVPLEVTQEDIDLLQNVGYIVRMYENHEF